MVQVASVISNTYSIYYPGVVECKVVIQTAMIHSHAIIAVSIVEIIPKD